MSFLERENTSCRCGCGIDYLVPETVEVIEDLERHFNSEARVTSACRCLSHNETVQKKYVKNYVPFSSKSQHLYFTAVDFKIVGVDPFEVYIYLVKKYPGKYGIGKYKTFTHLDSRPWPARW